MSQRLVLIDDTDPSIRYSGPWFKVQNTYDDIGNYGPPFENTLHGVNVSASFAFSFSGSSVTVLGTNATGHASKDLTWECFVDNTSIDSNVAILGVAYSVGSNYYSGPQNSWVFCQSAKLQDGPHVLTVQVTVSNQQTFWFDQIQYLPSSNVSLDQAVLLVDPSDPALQYSSGWADLNSISNYTETPGSNLTYEFSGISISWFGMTACLEFTSSSHTYSIDNQTPINFTIACSDKERYHELFFEAKNLSAGTHKLVVTCQGGSKALPFILDYLIVQNAPSPSSGSTISSSTLVVQNEPSPSSASTTSSSTSSNSMLSQGSTSKELSIGAIIGGVLGGLILLLLILFFLICRRRTRKSQKSNERFSPDSDAFHTMVQPFTLRPPSPPTTTTLHSPQMMINHKPSRSRQPTIPPITPSKVAYTSSPTAGLISASNSRLPDQTPLLNHSASLSERVPLTSSQTNLVDDVVTCTVREAEKVQRPASPASPTGNARFLRHEDSGIRMPPAEEEIVELPPLYTPG